MQREEGPAEVLVYIVDESYPPRTEEFENESDATERLSRAYHASLVAEFGHEFEDVNIGPGADLPAFATHISENAIPLLPWILAVLFSGKPLRDNIDAWMDLASRIKRYFSRPVLLNRNGAAALAVDATITEIGRVPRSIRLIGYHCGHVAEPDHLGQHENIFRIDGTAPSLNASTLRHVFWIEADGATFRVTVEGTKAQIARVG
jgi:hypothetical protein